MKWLIINTEAFSKAGIKVGKNASGEKTGKKEVDLSDLPKVLLLFLKRYRDPFIVLDECFVAGTSVDTVNDSGVVSKRIEDIKVGDRIINAAGEDTVVDTFKREVETIVEIRAGGKFFACSENHPFFTVRGWRCAKDLSTGGNLVSTAEAVRILRKDIYTKKHLSKVWSFLRKELLREMADAATGCAKESIHYRKKSAYIGCRESVYSRRFAEGCGACGKNTGTESDVTARECAANGRDKREERHAASVEGGARWERASCAVTCSKATRCSWRGLAHRVRCIAWKAARGISNLLQARSCLTAEDGRYRAGWFFAHGNTKATGHEERREAVFARVESITVLKQGSPALDKYRDADGKLYCYDIGAARHHSFSVSGVLVHNSSKIKVSTPMPEHKKSSRCRLIKLLNRFGDRAIATGTLKSKSPLNVYDQYAFLNPELFPETMYEFAERYCIMVTIRVGRGRRVVISEKIYYQIRTRLSNAWKRGGEEALEFSKASVAREYAMSYPNIEWIITHKEYTPFVNQHDLLRRIQAHTMFVKRSDVFDVAHEHFVHNPIMRYVDPTPEQKRLNNQLVTLGFTDEMSLGKAAALELVHRLQDVCNGFRPIEHIGENEERSFTYENLKENPKLDEVFNLIDEIDPEENQIALFCTRTNLIEAINERLESEGISYVWYKDGQKEEAEAAFKSGEARVFLSSLRPSAYGLNSLAQCSYAIYACVDEEAEAYYQSRHRLLRGQLTAPKFAYHVCVRGSVDEKRIRSLQRGVDLINYTNTKDTFTI